MAAMQISSYPQTTTGIVYYVCVLVRVGVFNAGDMLLQLFL